MDRFGVILARYPSNCERKRLCLETEGGTLSTIRARESFEQATPSGLRPRQTRVGSIVRTRSTPLVHIVGPGDATDLFVWTLIHVTRDGSDQITASVILQRVECRGTE